MALKYQNKNTVRWFCLVFILFFLITFFLQRKEITDYVVIEDTILSSVTQSRTIKTSDGNRKVKEIIIFLKENNIPIIIDHSSHKEFEILLDNQNNYGKKIRIYVDSYEIETKRNPKQIEINGQIIVPFSHHKNQYSNFMKVIFGLIIIILFISLIVRIKT